MAPRSKSQHFRVHGKPGGQCMLRTFTPARTPLTLSLRVCSCLQCVRVCVGVGVWVCVCVRAVVSGATGHVGRRGRADRTPVGFRTCCRQETWSVRVALLCRPYACGRSLAGSARQLLANAVAGRAKRLPMPQAKNAVDASGGGKQLERPCRGPASATCSPGSPARQAGSATPHCHARVPWRPETSCARDAEPEAYTEREQLLSSHAWCRS